jgi:hypothetical protein
MTFPALMQLVHAWIRRGVPSTSARTRWMFGFHRRLIRLCENVTDLPNQGFLPQTSHTAAIADRGYQSRVTILPHSAVEATTRRFLRKVASKS